MSKKSKTKEEKMTIKQLAIFALPFFFEYNEDKATLTVSKSRLKDDNTLTFKVLSYIVTKGEIFKYYPISKDLLSSHVDEVIYHNNEPIYIALKLPKKRDNWQEFIIAIKGYIIDLAEIVEEYEKQQNRLLVRQAKKKLKRKLTS